jgi:flagellar hook-length control protein FliK
MRHFAIDLKEAAENYKPPFTRLTMKLNPQTLGEVDVTLIQRGNNVHVTIQSNNTASVAFLAHNATELKAQLAQQGVTNATMNFMAGSDGQQQNPQQQQQQQQNQNRFRAYTSLEELHNNNQELSALEITIARYA